MLGNSIKKIGSVFLLLTFSTISASETPWHTILSQYPMQCYIAGAITTLIIGKLSYNYYQNHQETPELVIENCRSTYKNIYQEVQNYYSFYRSDVQISDWDLKEIIINNNQEPYPFMTYYKSLTRASWNLHNHLATLVKQLIKIDKHKKQLRVNRHSENTAHLRELFLQLEIKGKYLQEYTIKTITLIMILKNKIKLFKEYNDDCHLWAQTRQHNKQQVIA